MPLKSLDERVTDLELIYTDLPEILNLRFDGLRAQVSETTARLGLIDKQMATLTRDVRDIRSGVTLQLRMQDEKLGRMEADISMLKTDVFGLKTDVSALKTDVSALKTDVSALKTDVSALKTDVSALKTDVAAIKRDVAKMDASLFEILTILKK